MKNGFKKRTAVVITAIMTVLLLAFTGCTEAEGDHYDNAIKQEQKYQEYEPSLSFTNFPNLERLTLSQ